MIGRQTSHIRWTGCGLRRWRMMVACNIISATGRVRISSDSVFFWWWQFPSAKGISWRRHLIANTSIPLEGGRRIAAVTKRTVWTLWTLASRWELVRLSSASDNRIYAESDFRFRCRHGHPQRRSQRHHDLVQIQRWIIKKNFFFIPYGNQFTLLTVSALIVQN